MGTANSNADSACRIEHRLLEVLAGEGYPLTDELRWRTEHFVGCITPSGTSARIAELLEWLARQREACTMQVEEIPLHEAEHWSQNPDTGVIAHDSGGFFRVIYVRVRQGTSREMSEWCQPILYQDEMGILGILTRRQPGGREYLLQAKAEPGNVDRIQLSPTLQATWSNLKRLHGGRKPLFAEYFEHPRPGSVIYATNQTEDGGRLHLKYNLNMLVEVGSDEVLDIPPDFRWFTMFDIKQLLKMDNIVNLHVRSIISPL